MLPSSAYIGLRRLEDTRASTFIGVSVIGQSSEQPESHSLWSGPDAHGQAALFLIESLLHGLIEKSVLTTREALAIVDRAAEVKAENAADLGDSPEALSKSLALIDAIAASLQHDIGD